MSVKTKKSLQVGSLAPFVERGRYQDVLHRIYQLADGGSCAVWNGGKTNWFARRWR
jgi:hypothetical protein